MKSIIYKKVGPTRGTVIIQQSPQRRTVLSHIMDGQIRFFLGFPYGIFIVRFEKSKKGYKFLRLQNGWSKTPVDENSKIGRLRDLSNYEGGRLRVCMGNSVKRVAVSKGMKDLWFPELDQLLDAVLTAYWTSVFTLVDNAEIWEKKTKADPSYVNSKIIEIYSLKELVRMKTLQPAKA